MQRLEEREVGVSRRRSGVNFSPQPRPRTAIDSEAKNPASRRDTPTSLPLLVDLKHGEEGLLRHLDPPDLLHPLLALFLLLQQLLLARDVAPVELRGDVLAQRLDRLAQA